MEVQISTSSRLPTGFLDLPLELRLQIYRYCLVRNDTIDVDEFSYYYDSAEVRDDKKSLLLVSKKIGSEALDVLYGDNVFQIALHGRAGYYLQHHFTEANRQKFRMIQVLLRRPTGIGFGRDEDSTIFSPILANLKKFSIVPPHQMVHRYSKRDTQEWNSWLGGILQYFACQLPRSCILEVEDDYMREFAALVKEYLHCVHRKVQIVPGGLRLENDYYY